MSPPSAAAATGPSLDWRRLLRGNWVGAGVVALVTALTAGVLGVLTAVVARPEGFGLGHTLDLGTALACGAFGARLQIHATGPDYRVSGSVGTVPLTITVITLATCVLMFRRMTRAYPGPGSAFADAVRVALFVGIALVAPAAIFRGDNDKLGSGVGSELTAASTGYRAHYGTDVAQAFFFGLLLTLVVLGATVLTRRRWWSYHRARPVVDRIAAPIAGWAVLIGSLPVAGLVGFLLLGFGKPSVTEGEQAAPLHSILAIVAAGLGNGGLWLLSLGSGAAMGVHATASDGTSESSYSHLWNDITDQEPGLWAAPAVLLLVLAGAAWLVVRRSSRREEAAGNLVIWVLGLLLLVPLLVGLSGLRGGLTVTGGELPETESGSGVIGPHGVQATFFVVFAALVIAVLVAAATGTLTDSDLTTRLASAGRALQSDPSVAPIGGPSGPAVRPIPYAGSRVVTPPPPPPPPPPPYVPPGAGPAPGRDEPPRPGP